MRQNIKKEKREIFDIVMTHQKENHNKHPISIDVLADCLSIPRATAFRWLKELKMKMRQKWN